MASDRDDWVGRQLAAFLARSQATRDRLARPARCLTHAKRGRVNALRRRGAVKEFDTERVEIVNQLRLSAEKLTAIDKRLEEAEKASERLGCKDWKSLFCGIALGLIVNDAIPPEVAQHLFMGVVHGIAHLFGIGIPAEPRILA